MIFYFKTDPEDKIEKVRLRSIDVWSAVPHKHILSIDTFSQEKNTDIYDNTAIFDSHGTLKNIYKITGVQINILPVSQ